MAAEITLPSVEFVSRIDQRHFVLDMSLNLTCSNQSCVSKYPPNPLLPRFHQGRADAGFSAPAPERIWSKRAELVPDKAPARHRHDVGGNQVSV